MFGPAQGQMPFLTAKTADSGLENKNILKLDEKLDLETWGAKWSPDHDKGSIAPVQDKGM